MQQHPGHRNESAGRYDFETVLVGLGVDLAGWRLLHAMDASADGLTIVGIGDNPSGDREAWIARLPEPTGVPLLNPTGLVLLVAMLLVGSVNALRGARAAW